MTEYLFDHLQDIDFRTNSHRILFLDYDGTLIGFQNKPDQVSTPAHVQSIIDELADNSSITLVIITGRTLSDITRLVDTKKLIVAAFHGLKIRYPNSKEFVWEKAEKNRNLIQKIKKRSVQEFQHIKEIYIEDKTYTLAFHYRQVPDKKSKELIEKFISIYKKIDNEKKFEVLQGDKVIEIRPKDWNKGKAVEILLKKLENKKNDLFPIYIGDDTTDEDAFRFLQHRGLDIYVKNESQRETLAQYYVNNPNEVYKFLQWLKNNIR